MLQNHEDCEAKFESDQGAIPCFRMSPSIIHQCRISEAHPLYEKISVDTFIIERSYAYGDLLLVSKQGTSIMKRE